MRKSNKNCYGIIGLGRFGTALARSLAEAGADLVVLDREEDKVREMRELTENALIVPNLDKKTLEEAGIASCDVAVVCIGEQLDTSILTVLNLGSLGVKRIIAKASSAEHGEILEKLGAEVVFPERDMAVRLAHRLEAEKMLDLIQLSEKLNISKLRLSEKAVGKTVVELGIRKSFGVNIIAIENNGELIESVSTERKFKADDIIFVSGSREGLDKLTEWLYK